MKIKRFAAFAISALALGLSLSSCDDDISGIGNSLVGDQLNITVDSTLHVLKASTTFDHSFDARSQSLLLGNIYAPNYGSMASGFVTQLMPASSLNIPDSIGKERLDSVRIILKGKRGALTGDSLIPQQLSIFQLSKQLPVNISSSFDPSGYYDPQSPLASTSYTLSKLALKDSAFLKGADLRISTKVPTQWGLQIWDAYKSNPALFQWPANFNKVFPGLYVKQTFGSGNVAQFNSLVFMLYYHKLVNKNSLVNGENVTVQVHQADSAAVFASAPEVLSSNIISYSPSDFVKQQVASGKSIISSPGGYVVNIEFPLKDMLDRYHSNNFNLSVISNLTMQIPATTLDADLGLQNPPYLLMVKTSELQNFFNNNMVPDGVNSFWASYDSDKGCYRFTSMRKYFIDAVNKGSISEDDYKFTIVPVNISVETYTDSYTYKSITTVLSCKPYLGVPSLSVLDTDRVMICLTYSNQVIE